MASPQWFENWFNSPYYHLLYSHRNEEEADFFIRNICSSLQLPKSSKVWDLACGKGRHSLALFNLGYEVTGTDLSENSIREAKQHQKKGLDFEVHDMRESFRSDYFDAVLNLFTSLGYFSEECDNARVFKNVNEALKPGGTFIVDFFNAGKILKSFCGSYTEERGPITFHISKKINHNCIDKHIEFSVEGKDYFFEEKVSLLRLEDFEKFAADTSLKLSATYGNYQLKPFDAETSDRLILVYKKF